MKARCKNQNELRARSEHVEDANDCGAAGSHEHGGKANRFNSSLQVAQVSASDGSYFNKLSNLIEIGPLTPCSKIPNRLACKRWGCHLHLCKRNYNMMHQNMEKHITIQCDDVAMKT